MRLTQGSRRAYHEAWYRRAHNEPSPHWRQHPGSSRDLEVWMGAFDIAAEEQVSPWDALLLAVRRRAGRVRVVDQIIDAAWARWRKACEDDPELGDPDVPDEDVRRWMVESRNEERLLTRAAKMAIDAGVAKMLVERNQLAGQLVADAVVAGLDALNLTSEQRMLALGAAQRTFMSTGDEPPDQSNTIPGISLDDDTKED